MNRTQFFSKIKLEFERWCGIELTEQQVEQIFGDKEDLFQYVVECGLDTGGREYAMEIFAHELLARSWPCNRDSDDAFFSDLQVEMTKRGIKFGR